VSSALWRADEVTAMRAALDAACKGVRGANPLVGASIIVDQQIVATGYHHGAGTAHAEVEAITQAQTAGYNLQGATAVVTLEPCNHTGRTGPCTRALVDAGISRVVYAVADPHRQASGGADYLRRSGVDVASGLCADEARQLNRRWLRAITENRPFVTAKIAQSIDGFVAAADGSSQWITGTEARRAGHELRAQADAILVGTGTVAADNPRLSARNEHGVERETQPLRVVMGHTPVPPTAALRDGRWCQLHTHNPQEALAQLAAQGIEHVLVEGGPTITTAFLAADLVDSLLVHQAPVSFGTGKPSVGDLGITTLAAARRFVLDTPPEQCGDDIVLHLSPTQ
jgi:diaminohydroxyphosphoribosylaminopyrimidine deaminase/5-amino-6-(5-phosphoribosylamino)uracil reductase